MTDPIAALRQAREALAYMHEEKCDYMRRNNLGDPLREDAARLAVPAIAAADAALAAAPQPAADNPDPLHLSRILHELAGAASMPAPPGEFWHEKAIEHVERAIAEIRERQAALAAPPPAAAEAVQPTGAAKP